MANSIVEKNRNLPELSRHEQIYARADSIMIRRYRPTRNGMGRAESSLADLDAIMPEAQVALADLRALAQPASKMDIAKQLAILVKCYPNAGNADAEIYGRLLIEDVAAMQPAIGDLEAACRNLRRTSKFIPAISEVLEAIADAKNHRYDITRKLIDLTTSRDKQVREVEKEREQHQLYLDYQRTCWQPGDINDDPTAPPLITP
jgi:hypothetical protein